MNEEQIKPGDIVRLKTGGEPFVVGMLSHGGQVAQLFSHRFVLSTNGEPYVTLPVIVLIKIRSDEPESPV